MFMFLYFGQLFYTVNLPLLELIFSRALTIRIMKSFLVEHLPLQKGLPYTHGQWSAIQSIFPALHFDIKSGVKQIQRAFWGTVTSSSWPNKRSLFIYTLKNNNLASIHRQKCLLRICEIQHHSPRYLDGSYLPSCQVIGIRPWYQL